MSEDTADSGHGLPAAPLTELDQLFADAQAIEAKPLVVKVAAMPGYTVTYRTDMTGDEFDRIMRNNTKTVRIPGRPAKEERDLAGINRSILAEACIAIAKDDKQIQDTVDGGPLLFSSRALLAGFGVSEVGLAILAFFKGRDQEIRAHVDAVMDANGYGQAAEVVDEELDPTSGA